MSILPRTPERTPPQEPNPRAHLPALIENLMRLWHPDYKLPEALKEMILHPPVIVDGDWESPPRDYRPDILYASQPSTSQDPSVGSVRQRFGYPESGAEVPPEPIKGGIILRVPNPDAPPEDGGGAGDVIASILRGVIVGSLQAAKAYLDDMATPHQLGPDYATPALMQQANSIFNHSRSTSTRPASASTVPLSPSAVYSSPNLSQAALESVKNIQQGNQAHLQQRLSRNEQAAYQGGLASAITQAYGSANVISQVPFDKQRGYAPDTYAPPTSTGQLERLLHPDSGYSSQVADTTNIAYNLSHAQIPRTTEQVMRQLQAEALERERFQANLDEKYEAIRLHQARRRVEELRLRNEMERLRQTRPQQPIQARISQQTYQGIVLPPAVYKDPITGENVNLWNALAQGQDLNDRQVDQLILTLENLKYSAQTPEALIDAEVLDNYAREQVIENRIENLQEADEEDMWLYRGLKLERIEAEMAVTFDTEHYWQNETHLSPKQIQDKLREYAVGLWNFLYGDDIATLLDAEAHPLARVWAAAQLFPVMKMTKAGKLIKLVKFNTKGVPFSRFLPEKPTLHSQGWVGTKSLSPIAYAEYKASKHLPEFSDLGITTKEDYLRLAEKIRTKPLPGTFVKTLLNGEKVMYHPDLNLFHVNIRGNVISFYRPAKGLNKLGEPSNKGVFSGYFRRRK